jgi:uncharacterized protein
VKDRVVIDTSTLISAALRSNSVPDQALHKALEEHTVVGCPETIAELRRVLSLAKFDRYIDTEGRRKFMSLLANEFEILNVPESVPLHPSCRDPKDNKFLALAVVAHADLIVSSDADLLILHPWRGISILTPAQFLAGS